MKWLDKVPLLAIFVIALFLALAPVLHEPHLWQKSKMLASGSLIKPVDMLDLVLHGAPLIILVLKLVRVFDKKKSNDA